MNTDEDSANENSSSIRKLVKAVSALVPWITLVAVLWSGYIAWQALQFNQRLSRVNSYLLLRAHYFEQVSGTIPREYFQELDIAAPTKETTDWRALERYWYSAFDEWFVTRHLNDPELRVLWDSIYIGIVSDVLDRRPFREVACDLIEVAWRGNKLREAFGAELKRLYKARNNDHPMCAGRP